MSWTLKLLVYVTVARIKKDWIEISRDKTAREHCIAIDLTKDAVSSLIN